MGKIFQVGKLFDPGSIPFALGLASRGGLAWARTLWGSIICGRVGSCAQILPISSHQGQKTPIKLFLGAFIKILKYIISLIYKNKYIKITLLSLIIILKSAWARSAEHTRDGVQ